MPDEAYFTTGGGLKLKGVSSGSGVSKKKKKKASVEKAAEVTSAETIGDAQKEEQGEAQAPSGRALTEAEKRFEETRRKRQQDKAAKMAQKSHKERVQEFNAYLESLSEHHDIPRVGPG
ncbi:hypothetical protein BC830DRAFT_904850 [Chytriomyces sp. MP71]|nr:hypothetical protein BC830DRAFT_904850 [Chytriomyces sp. MP71]